MTPDALQRVLARLAQAEDVCVAFQRSNGFLSKVIRWCTRGRVSHALGTFALPGLACREVLEADWPGVLVRPLGAHDALAYEFRPPPGVDLRAGMLEAAKCIGHRYGYEELAGMAPVEGARLLGLRVRNPLRNSKTEICSELWAIAMKAAKWPGAEGLDPGATDPEELLTLCERAHG